MKFLLAISILFISHSAISQFEYQNLLERKKYSKVFKKVLGQYKKNPESVKSNYSMSVLFNIGDSKFVHRDTAYYFGLRSKGLIYRAEQKEIEKLEKKGLNEASINDQLNVICESAFAHAKSRNSISEYNHFLKIFTNKTTLINEATKLRNKIAFEQANQSNTIESFQSFIDTYPNSVEIRTAKSKRNGLAFDVAQNDNTIESYQLFIDAYPKADEIRVAKLHRDEIVFAAAKAIGTSSAMTKFIVQYPDSELQDQVYYEHDRLHFYENRITGSPSNGLEYLRSHASSKYLDVIVDSVYLTANRHNDYYSLKFLAENASSFNLHDSVWLHFYSAYARSGHSDIIDDFRDEYEYQFPYESFLSRAYIDALTAELFENNEINMRNSDLRDYFKSNPETYRSFQLVQKIVEPSLKRKNWKQASSLINQLQTDFDYKNSYLNGLQKTLANGDDNIRKARMSSAVNTSKGGEYVPVISADNKLLYFCGKDRSDNYFGEDIFVSVNRNGTWGKADKVDDLNTYGNDAPLSVSTDGNTLFLFKNGDLFFSKREVYGWSELIEFPHPINSDFWDADLMQTSDGKSLLFSSARDTDHPRVNMIDIYISHKTETGWSEPMSLGSTINTEFDDRSPFLHPDMKTLYFSSGGHGGLGDLDVFMTTRLNDSTWTDWSEPINLGREFNTIGMDWGYKISTDGKMAYFAAADKNGLNDIYTVELPSYLRPGFVATIEGALVDKDNKPIEATIIWEDLETGEAIGESKSNPTDGSYFIVLPMGKIYGYYIENGDYYPISSHLDLREEDNAVKINQDIEIVTFDQMIEDAVAVPMNNLFFNTGKWNLLPVSKPELKRIAVIIKTNNLQVEIAGHTDNVGTDEFNLTLSENRANAVMDYLEMLGVLSELMTTVGYGESRPNVTNETDEGRAKNRRVELRFVDH